MPRRFIFSNLYKVDSCFFKNHLNALEMDYLSLSKWNVLILCSIFISTNCLEFLEPLKTIHFGLRCIQPHFPQNILDEHHKIPYTAYKCGFCGATYVGIYNLKGLVVAFYSKMQLHVVCFQCMLLKTTRMWGIFFLQMFKSFILSKWPRWLCLSSNAPSSIGYVTNIAACYPCTFTKFILYKLLSHGIIAINFLFQVFRMRLFKFNYIFKPLNRSFLSNNKLFCMLRTYSTSLPLGWSYLLGDFTSNNYIMTMDPSPIDISWCNYFILHETQHYVKSYF